jgi:hypothetical protein
MDLRGLSTPVAVSQLPRFERQNGARLGLRINVLYAEDRDVYPLYSSPLRAGNVCNLLLAKDSAFRTHYVLVTDVEKLLVRSYRDADDHQQQQKTKTKTKTTKKKTKGYCSHGGKKLRCGNCLNSFSRESALAEHEELCRNNRTQRTMLPKQGETLGFTAFAKRFRTPLVGYFDFETSQVAPENACPTGSCPSSAECRHLSGVEAEQRAITFALVIVDDGGRIVHQHCESSRREDAAEAFLEHLLEIEPELLRLLRQRKPLRLTPEEEGAFAASTECHICGQRFVRQNPRLLGADESMIKCRDHCHLTGR